HVVELNNRNDSAQQPLYDTFHAVCSGSFRTGKETSDNAPAFGHGSWPVQCVVIADVATKELVTLASTVERQRPADGVYDTASTSNDGVYGVYQAGRSGVLVSDLLHLLF